MFLLNNIHDRPYREIYKNIPNVAYDISDGQLKNVKNRDWSDIKQGSIVCVVNSTRKISTFRRIEECRKSDVTDESGDFLNVITGPVIGKLKPDVELASLLRKYNVNHPYLPRKVFTIGFNIGNLGGALDALAIETRNGRRTVGELKQGT